MKKVYYVDGPPKLCMGVTLFEINVPKEIEDSLADKLIAKGFKLYEEPVKVTKTKSYSYKENLTFDNKEV